MTEPAAAMIEAGMRALFDPAAFRDCWEGTVARVYRAMQEAEELEKLRQEAIAKLQAQVDECDRLLKADAAEASTWRPIETAPMDGTPILLAEYCENRWQFGTSYWREYLPPYGAGFGWIGHAPTHWMPLPPAPTGADTGSPGSNEQAESASPSVLLIRGEK